MSSKIKVDTIENVAGSGNVSLGSGHNLVVPGNNTTSGNATVGGTLGVTGATTIGGLTTLNGKFLIDGSNNDLMTFRTTGDTASQVLGLQFQNNSEAVTAQIFGTGDNSSNGVFRIKGIGNVDIVGGDIGVTAAQADLRVASNGVVTTPKTPAFRASRTAGNYSSAVTIVWDNVIYNQGSHYDNSNGRFTAPVAGIYQFNVMGSVTAGAANMGIHRVRINNSYQADVFPIASVTVNHISYANSFLFNLSANDYVDVTASSGTWYGSGNIHNHFSGFLVG